MARHRRQDRGAETRHADKARKPGVPEFSRMVDVSRIGRLEHRVAIAAKPEECQALARRLDLLELPELSAELVLKKRGDGVFELSGRCHARVAQASVVSLEPVWATLDDEIRQYFGGGLAEEAAAFDPLDEEGWPEPIEAGQVDLGEAVTQWLAVALDPYPRLPGETLAGS